MGSSFFHFSQSLSAPVETLGDERGLHCPILPQSRGTRSPCRKHGGHQALTSQLPVRQPQAFRHAAMVSAFAGALSSEHCLPLAPASSSTQLLFLITPPPGTDMVCVSPCLYGACPSTEPRGDAPCPCFSVQIWPASETRAIGLGSAAAAAFLDWFCPERAWLCSSTAPHLAPKCGCFWGGTWWQLYCSHCVPHRIGSDGGGGSRSPQGMQEASLVLPAPFP